MAKDDDTDQTFELISQCAQAFAGAVTGYKVVGVLASTIQSVGATLSGIAQNTDDPQAAENAASKTLSQDAASLVGKTFKTEAGDKYRISIGQLVSGARCISFVQIVAGQGEDTTPVEPGNPCIPDPNDPNWQPPYPRCFLGVRPVETVSNPVGDGQHRLPGGDGQHRLPGGDGQHRLPGGDGQHRG
ncbi:hypothetical protein [Streptomyces sp. ok210]|uniref:hypothetical protein n=1 Tax=Streptomyces sp. ok210 TaxID=1761905 RepID=UPI001160B091|nr:hypothetical protein [Streptomyces sp. ok210]